MYNLEQKDSTEYNGIESYVSDKIANDDIGWFPIGRAIAIKDEDEEN